jgi:hypothetical protein
VAESVRGSAYFSEAFQELEDGVALALALALGLPWSDRSESAFLHRQVSLDIAVSSNRALVTQPKGDGCDIDARLQQVHGGCMPPLMRRNFAPFQLRARLRRCGDSQRKPSGNTRACHCQPLAVRHEVLIVAQLSVLQPVTDSGSYFFS